MKSYRKLRTAISIMLILGFTCTVMAINPGEIVINEANSHTDGYALDHIELHNTTGSAIDISGFYLDDDDDDLNNAFRIPGGTIIASHGYVFYNQNTLGFNVSSSGEDLYFLEDSGNPLIPTILDTAEMPQAPRDSQYGRFLLSDGITYVWTQLNTVTLGGTNGSAKVGPIVINEIMYNPPNPDAEYIELYNPTGSAVTLYDARNARAWEITDGFTYMFPTGSPITIDAGEYILLVANSTIFNLVYGGLVPGGVQIIQWTSGSVSNGGERLEISLSDNAAPTATTVVDMVRYDDDYPWPIGSGAFNPDGGGASISRIVAIDYGNDPGNWEADPTPTPGAVNQ